MISDYIIHSFSLEHYPLMKELFLSAFDAEIDFKTFQKKYDTKNLGHEIIGFLAVHKITKEPSAYYGVFPVKALINGKEVLIAQSGDTMTHKNHRKKGLFVHLAKITFDECCNRGIQFIFGLPNKNSYHGFVNKLDWLHVDDVERFDLKLAIKTFPLPKLCLKANLFSNYIKYAKRVLKKAIVKDPFQFCNPQAVTKKILRNKEYLEYKATSDKVFIKINGVVLWIKFTDVFWIGDIDNYEMFDLKIIQELKRLAFLLGYNTISFHINKNAKPGFLRYFKQYNSEALCYYYINKEDYQGTNLIITAADFDTW